MRSKQLLLPTRKAASWVLSSHPQKLQVLQRSKPDAVQNVCYRELHILSLFDILNCLCCEVIFFLVLFCSFSVLVSDTNQFWLHITIEYEQLLPDWDISDWLGCNVKQFYFCCCYLKFFSGLWCHHGASFFFLFSFFLLTWVSGPVCAYLD